MIQKRSYLKTKFETGDIPTQQDFIDLFDSFLHLDTNENDKVADIFISSMNFVSQLGEIDNHTSLLQTLNVIVEKLNSVSKNSNVIVVYETATDMLDDFSNRKLNDLAYVKQIGFFNRAENQWEKTNITGENNTTISDQIRLETTNNTFQNIEQLSYNNFIIGNDFGQGFYVHNQFIADSISIYLADSNILNSQIFSIGMYQGTMPQKGLFSIGNVLVKGDIENKIYFPEYEFKADTSYFFTIMSNNQDFGVIYDDSKPYTEGLFLKGLQTVQGSLKFSINAITKNYNYVKVLPTKIEINKDVDLIKGYTYKINGVDIFSLITKKIVKKISTPDFEVIQIELAKTTDYQAVFLNAYWLEDSNWFMGEINILHNNLSTKISTNYSSFNDEKSIIEFNAYIIDSKIVLQIDKQGVENIEFNYFLTNPIIFNLI